MIRTGLLVVGLWLGSCGAAHAGPVAQGYDLWEAGDHGGAEAIWQDSARAGTPSGVLLYDLGLAAYDRGDLPRAVAHWRAARRLRPRDARLAHNLAEARAKLQGAGAPYPMTWGWMEFATAGEVGLLGLAALLGAGLRLALRRDRTNRRPWVATWVAGLALTLLALLGARDLLTHPVLVVVDAPAVARDGARADAEERFVLQPGSEVRADRLLGDFVLVRTGSGERGWIPTSALLGVEPGASRYAADPYR